MFFRKERISLVIMTLIAAFLFSIGCQQKQAEPVKKEEVATQQPAPSQPAVDTTKKVEEAKPVEPEVTVQGTWNGKLDINPATLKITAVDGNKFSGTINVKAREEVKQNVSGEINKEKLTFTMKDMIAARSAGTYSGTISKDFKTMSGTFFMKLDNVKVKFSFSKK